MYKHTYIHKETGIKFKRTKKDVALRQLKDNPKLKFFIVGCNVNESHFHNRWHLATGIYKGCSNIDALFIYNQFKYYLEPELGHYPVFYVEII